MESDRKLKKFAFACAILVLLAASCGAAWSCHATPGEIGREEQEGDTKQGGAGEKGQETPEEDGTGTNPTTKEPERTQPGEEPGRDEPTTGEGRNPQEPISGELPQAWDYVEEDEAAVTLSGKEALFEILPEDALASLEDGLLAFLKENGEYRRELEVAPETVAASDGQTTFRVRFRTGRLDGREIMATHGGGGFEFSLELPEAGGSPEAAGTSKPTDGREVGE